MVGGGPVRAPLPQRTGILQRSGPLFEQEQVMQRIEDILLPPIDSGVARQELALAENLYMEGKGLEDQHPPRFFRRNRVPIGLIGPLTVGIQMHLARAAALTGA